MHVPLVIVVTVVWCHQSVSMVVVQVVWAVKGIGALICNFFKVSITLARNPVRLEEGDSAFAVTGEGLVSFNCHPPLRKLCYKTECGFICHLDPK